MEREEYCKLAIKLLQEELNGMKIVFSQKDLDMWSPLVIGNKGLIVYDFERYDYRIKPEKKLVPFTWEDREFLMGKIIKSKDGFVITTIIGIVKSVDGSFKIDLSIHPISPNQLFLDYTFLDGSPCGKEVEE